MRTCCPAVESIRWHRAFGYTRERDTYFGFLLCFCSAVLRPADAAAAAAWKQVTPVLRAAWFVCRWMHLGRDDWI